VTTRRTGFAIAVVFCATLAPLAGRADASSTYVVRPGDTLWAVAHRLGVTVTDLASANRLSSAAPIHPGQPLVVPDAVTTSRSGSARTALPSRGTGFRATVVQAALRFLGRPYQWSGIGQRGFDCSGLVFRVFEATGMALPHSSFAQYRIGTPVAAAALAGGDLVFFRTHNRGPSHVGIYIDGSRFVHASASRGVIVSSLNEPYYRARYLGARRP